jgi:xanthine dehydrogenase accessory factor
MQSTLLPADGIYDLACRLSREGRGFAVATVLGTLNSTPVKAGAKALVEDGGKTYGTVGGGQVEAETLRRAQEVMKSGKAVVFDFDLRGPGAHEPSPICGGAMRVLVAPGQSASAREYQRAAAAMARRESGVWVTRLQCGRELKVKARFSPEKNSAGAHSQIVHAKRASLRDGSPRLLEVSAKNGVSSVFLEPILPEPRLLIVGGGHVSQALAAQAKLLGFQLVVFEDRPQFADAGIFPPGTRAICGDVGEQLARFPIDRNTYIALVTRGHQQDALALRACIHSPAAYIGMIGSRRKVPLVRRRFLQSGWATAEDFKRVYAPIGLDLGAVTVPEIATSIVAQLVAVRRKGIAARMPLRCP